MHRQLLIYTLILFMTWQPLVPVLAQQKLKDFRGTQQKVALVGFFNEFVEPSAEENLLKESRKAINRYTRTFSKSAISQFKIISNPNNIYLKPADPELGDVQKEFLSKLGEDNQIDIVVLGIVREAFDGIEMELQLYDIRIQTLSGIERSTFNLRERSKAVDDLIFRLMNYLDRDGFVHPQPQDFLQKPVHLADAADSLGGLNQLSDEEFFVSPEELGGQPLAGEVSIGGEKTPFWERWWFWTAIFGSLATAGSLAYFFLVVDQPPSGADIDVQLQKP
jgi:hypothetical protein